MELVSTYLFYIQTEIKYKHPWNPMLLILYASVSCVLSDIFLRYLRLTDMNKTWVGCVTELN